MIIEVSGNPKPQPRPRMTKWGGVYYPQSQGRKDWYLALREAVMRAKPIDFKPFNEPVAVSIVYRFKMSGVDFKAGVAAPVSKTYGDCDNLNKCCLDRLTDFNIWADDSLVCALSSIKYFDNESPGAIIRINRIEF